MPDSEPKFGMAVHLYDKTILHYELQLHIRITDSDTLLQVLTISPLYPSLRM